MFEPTPLRYTPHFLLPYLDEETVSLHHGAYYASCIEQLNRSVEGTFMKGMPLEELLQQASRLPDSVRCNAGAVYNHNLYFEMLTSGTKTPSPQLSKAINSSFGSWELFKRKFFSMALSFFGSGWLFLMKEYTGKLDVCVMPGEDNPLMDVAEKRGIPLLAMDLWEHAYYPLYRHNRAAYVDAFWQLIHWHEVSKRYEMY